MIYVRNWKLSIRKDKLRHQEMSKNSANNQLAGLQMVLWSRLAREHNFRSLEMFSGTVPLELGESVKLCQCFFLFILFICKSHLMIHFLKFSMIDLFHQHQAELVWTFHLVTAAFLVHNLTGELLVALNQINWSVSGCELFHLCTNSDYRSILEKLQVFNLGHMQ